MQIENSQKKWARYMAIFALIGLCLFPMPWIANFDEIESLVTFLVGMFMVIVGTFQFLIFLDKARQMDNLLNNKNVISRWKIEPQIWKEFVNIDSKVLKEKIRKVFFYFVIAFLFVIAYSLVRFDNHHIVFFLLYSGVVFAIIFMLIWFSIMNLNRKRQNRDSGEVIIAHNCLILNDEFHVLSDFGNRLEGIVYYEAERILEFKYSYIDINRIYRRKNLDVRVPVPATEEAQLQKVLKHFGE
jgi:hypothetical protein